MTRSQDEPQLQGGRTHILATTAFAFLVRKEKPRLQGRGFVCGGLRLC
jgi:hypothetical protein